MKRVAHLKKFFWGKNWDVKSYFKRDIIEKKY